MTRGDFGKFLQSTGQLPLCLSVYLKGSQISPPQQHHLDLEDIYFQRAKKSIKAYRDSRKAKFSDNSTTLEPPPKKLSKSKSKPKRLSRLEVRKCIVKNNIQRTTVICCSRWKKERRSGICAVIFTNAKCKGYPRKTGNIQNVGARKSKIKQVRRWL